MGVIANSVFTLLLSWVRSAVSGLWSLLFESNQGGTFRWIGENWKQLALIICLVGVITDVVVHQLRWRPHWVWFSFLRRVFGRDKGEEREQDAPVPSRMPPNTIRQRADTTQRNSTRIRSSLPQREIPNETRRMTHYQQRLSSVSPQETMIPAPEPTETYPVPPVPQPMNRQSYSGFRQTDPRNVAPPTTPIDNRPSPPTPSAIPTSILKRQRAVFGGTEHYFCQEGTNETDRGHTQGGHGYVPGRIDESEGHRYRPMNALSGQEERYRPAVMPHPGKTSE